MKVSVSLASCNLNANWSIRHIKWPSIFMMAIIFFWIFRWISRSRNSCLVFALLFLASRTVLSNRSHLSSVSQTIFFICFTSSDKLATFDSNSLGFLNTSCETLDERSVVLRSISCVSFSYIRFLNFSTSSSSAVIFVTDIWLSLKSVSIFAVTLFRNSRSSWMWSRRRRSSLRHSLTSWKEYTSTSEKKMY